MDNLAPVYRLAGKPDQGLQLLEEALKLMRAKLGPDHPTTLGTINNLAVAYREAGKLDQALPLQEEALKLMRAKLGPDHPNILRAMINLAHAYREAGKLDQAMPLQEEALKLMRIRLGPDHPITLDNTAEVFARGGQFAEAAAIEVRLRGVKPENHLVWHNLAALFIASGQLDAYREHCFKSAERFGQTTDPVTAERIAKDCLILPASGVDLDLVAKMADTAVAATNHPGISWFQLVKGLAEYRKGRFSEAIEWVSKSLTETRKESDREVQAYMALAMAYYQLRQFDEAEAAFSRGADIERTKLPRLESGDIGGGWLNWIIAHALMREAKALIQGDSETKAETK